MIEHIVLYCMHFWEAFFSFLGASLAYLYCYHGSILFKHCWCGGFFVGGTARWFELGRTHSCFCSGCSKQAGLCQCTQRYCRNVSSGQKTPADPGMPRKPEIANSPSTILSTFQRRDYDETASNRLAPRRSPNTVLWCAPGSQTYVILQITHAVPGDLIMVLLNTAYNSVMDVLETRGDGLLARGGALWRANGLTMMTYNSNNHQTTWSVMGAAIVALRDYMSRNGWGAATFRIFDGANEVGAGALG